MIDKYIKLTAMLPVRTFILRNFKCIGLNKKSLTYWIGGISYFTCVTFTSNIHTVSCFIYVEKCQLLKELDILDRRFLMTLMKVYIWTETRNFSVIYILRQCSPKNVLGPKHLEKTFFHVDIAFAYYFIHFLFPSLTLVVLNPWGGIISISRKLKTSERDCCSLSFHEEENN